MRSLIIGLAVLFFTASVFITIKALGIPPRPPSSQEEREGGKVGTTALKQLAEQEAANRVLVADLQATIARLEDKLTTKEEAIQSMKAVEDKNKPRTLTVFGGGTFRSGQDVINDISFDTIEELVREISASPSSRVIIEGHTDNVPINPSAGRQYKDNMDLSFLRAKAIANILTFHDISTDRISVIGYGDTRPIDTNDTEEGRARNRRVEVKLVPRTGER